ncbi:hypothetical protein PPERSA_00690 [Pseudocohnilembus persalinus]|uniref:Transmembrane protein n=1 Tax=Pseudocohnilembus persalinus TaxID=266149 RepID=A0A0V0QTB0_PSEPJ|nr:hypothetical protein PPERSA_00690 [Pseudocohnilembus persalinus]|eukprot:KRX05389.1 hypothetical protein PPERSA_00690 [Pseudocohnilembus persalinus]
METSNFQSNFYKLQKEKKYGEKLKSGVDDHFDRQIEKEKRKLIIRLRKHKKYMFCHIAELMIKIFFCILFFSMAVNCRRYLRSFQDKVSIISDDYKEENLETLNEDEGSSEIDFQLAEIEQFEFLISFISKQLYFIALAAVGYVIIQNWLFCFKRKLQRNKYARQVQNIQDKSFLQLEINEDDSQQFISMEKQAQRQIDTVKLLNILSNFVWHSCLWLWVLFDFVIIMKYQNVKESEQSLINNDYELNKNNQTDSQYDFLSKVMNDDLLEFRNFKNSMDIIIYVLPLFYLTQIIWFGFIKLYQRKRDAADIILNEMQSR